MTLVSEKPLHLITSMCWVRELENKGEHVHGNVPINDPLAYLSAESIKGTFFWAYSRIGIAGMIKIFLLFLRMS